MSTLHFFLKASLLTSKVSANVPNLRHHPGHPPESVVPLRRVLFTPPSIAVPPLQEDPTVTQGLSDNDSSSDSASSDSIPIRRHSFNKKLSNHHDMGSGPIPPISRTELKARVGERAGSSSSSAQKSSSKSGNGFRRSRLSNAELSHLRAYHEKEHKRLNIVKKSNSGKSFGSSPSGVEASSEIQVKEKTTSSEKSTATITEKSLSESTTKSTYADTEYPPDPDATSSFHQNHRRRKIASYVSEQDTVAITRLQNLYNSQYVGSIGVGTIARPHGCADAAQENLEQELALAEKDSLNKSGLSLAQGLSSPASMDSLLEQAAAGTLKLDVNSTLSTILAALPKFISKDYADASNCHYEEQSTVNVVFDSGSTNVWVASDLCRTSPCTNPDRHRYSHSLSETFKDSDRNRDLDIEFGTGELRGTQGIDDFHLHPFTVKQQTFGMIAEEVGDAFQSIPFEGILGLAFPSMSANGVTPFFDNVIDQKVLKKNEFSFYFNVDEASTVGSWAELGDNSNSTSSSSAAETSISKGSVKTPTPVTVTAAAAAVPTSLAELDLKVAPGLRAAAAGLTESLGELKSNLDQPHDVNHLSKEEVAKVFEGLPTSELEMEELMVHPSTSSKLKKGKEGGISGGSSMSEMGASLSKEKKSVLAKSAETKAESSTSSSKSESKSSSSESSGSVKVSTENKETKETSSDQARREKIVREQSLLNNNAIFWGGVDSAFYEKPIRVFPVVQQHYWALALHSFRVGNEVYDISTGERLDSSQQSLNVMGRGGSMSLSEVSNLTPEQENRLLESKAKELKYSSDHVKSEEPKDPSSLFKLSDISVTGASGSSSLEETGNVLAGLFETAPLSSGGFVVNADGSSTTAASLVESSSSSLSSSSHNTASSQDNKLLRRGPLKPISFRESFGEVNGEIMMRDMPGDSLTMENEVESETRLTSTHNEGVVPGVDLRADSGVLESKGSASSESSLMESASKKEEAVGSAKSKSKDNLDPASEVVARSSPDSDATSNLESSVTALSSHWKELTSKAPPVTTTAPARLVVDSGTTYFTAGKELFRTLLNRLPGGRPCDELSEEDYPPLVYVLENSLGEREELIIPQEVYMVTDSTGKCDLAFMQIDLPDRYGPGMLLGEVFMRHYFTTFSRDGYGGSRGDGQSFVGFAKAKVGDEPRNRLVELVSGPKAEFQDL